jgi:hypothetical protein
MTAINTLVVSDCPSCSSLIIITHNALITANNAIFAGLVSVPPPFYSAQTLVPVEVAVDVAV